jgi:septal ring factor EnvC (AmiA/AmiB activator)
MKKYLKYYLLFIIFNIYLFANCQSLENLNETKKKIESQIQKLNTLITENTNIKTETLNNLNLVNQRINLKKSLIKQIESEILYLNNSIINKQNSLDSLSVVLNYRKDELVNVLQFYQKTLNNYNVLIFILSSNSFNQSYLRIKFYNSIIRYYSQTLKSLENDINSINIIKTSLENQKNELYLKQLQKVNEIKLLEKDIDLYRVKLEKLKANESKLRKQVEAEKKRNSEIVSKIRELIEEEARKKINSKVLSNDQIKLSNDFVNNFGKLPHPVRDAFVLSEFGETNHPVLKGVKIKNNGVDFACKNGSEVYSIFGGEVKKIFNLPMNGIAIIIRHGNYLSVYSNLSTVFIKVGDKVNLNQPIGKIETKGSTNSILHFEIWNEKSPENPLLWIN